MHPGSQSVRIHEKGHSDSFTNVSGEPHVSFNHYRIDYSDLVWLR